MKLPSWAPLVLFPLGGAAAGLAGGVLLTNPAAFIGLATPVAAVALAGGAAAGGYVAWRRVSRARSTRREAKLARDAEAAARTRAATSLVARVELPDVPDGVPDVWGAGDALRVRFRVTREGRPAAGSRLEAFLVAGDAASGERRALAGPLTVGADGAVDSPLVIPEAGEVRFEVEATLDGAHATAARAIRLVKYEHEVHAIFNDFRVWANQRVPGCRDALTAREVADVISPTAGVEGSRALAEVARIYELVAYGERKADRGLYLALLAAFNDLEESGLFNRYAAPPKPGG